MLVLEPKIIYAKNLPCHLCFSLHCSFQHDLPRSCRAVLHVMNKIALQPGSPILHLSQLVSNLGMLSHVLPNFTLWNTKSDCMHADYCFGDVKFGGNAQAITKQRFLHHTSLLWDYQSKRMRLLKHPAKIPDYRAVIHLTMQEGPFFIDASGWSPSQTACPGHQ